MRGDYIQFSLPAKPVQDSLFLEDGVDIAASMLVQSFDTLFDFTKKVLTFSVTFIPSLAQENIDSINKVHEALKSIDLLGTINELGGELAKPFKKNAAEAKPDEKLIDNVSSAQKDGTAKNEKTVFSIFSDVIIPIESVGVTTAKMACKLSGNDATASQLKVLSHGNTIWKEGRGSVERYQNLENEGEIFSKKKQMILATMISGISAIFAAFLGLTVFFLEETTVAVVLLPYFEASCIISNLWSKVAEKETKALENANLISPLELQARENLLMKA